MMDVHSHYTIFIDEYDNQALKKDLGEVIDICQNHNISETFLSFGYQWDVVKQVRNHYMISLDQIMSEVEKYEECNFGMLGKDELTLKFSDLEFDVQYCYQGDVHINFDTINPIILDILKNWDKKGWHYKKYDNRNPGNENKT